MPSGPDSVTRALALARLDEIVDALGPSLHRSEFRNVDLDGEVVHLADRQKGIWNPAWLDATLSVLTTFENPYGDRELGEGVWEYKYRKGSTAGDNAKLHRAYELGVDVIYFRGLEGGRYEPIYPVRIVDSRPDERLVILAAKDLQRIDWREGVQPSLRRYAETMILRRLHQDAFRVTVLRAYESSCAVCRLQFEPLLDAAHIDRDRSEEGEPVIDNGLALCKLHHAAYDANIIGISPDYVVRTRLSVRNAIDGPVLEYALKGVHGQTIWMPRNASEHPNPLRLERRFREFQNA